MSHDPGSTLAEVEGLFFTCLSKNIDKVQEVGL